MLKKEDAHSTEFAQECADPVVIFMPEGSKTHMGGTMRLGSRATVLKTHDCHAARLYRPCDSKIHERHRHRYVLKGM
jgi:CTP synthase